MQFLPVDLANTIRPAELSPQIWQRVSWDRE